MSKTTRPTIELSDADKRDLIQLIQAGKPLPERYRFILFEDKREVELVWNGNSRVVCTAVLPFQALGHVDDARKETTHQGELTSIWRASSATRPRTSRVWSRRSGRIRVRGLDELFSHGAQSYSP